MSGLAPENTTPSGEWELGPVLPVLLDKGEDLNAFYDRQALNFFHGSSPDGTLEAQKSAPRRSAAAADQ